MLRLSSIRARQISFTKTCTSSNDTLAERAIGSSQSQLHGQSEEGEEGGRTKEGIRGTIPLSHVVDE